MPDDFVIRGTGLSEAERRERYARQRGVDNPEAVTASQQRRLAKKARHNLATLERAAREQRPL